MSSHPMFRVVRVVQSSFLCSFFRTIVCRLSLGCCIVLPFVELQSANISLVSLNLSCDTFPLYEALSQSHAGSLSEYDVIVPWVMICVLSYFKWGPSWRWSYGSWIYSYLCNQWLSPLMLWVRISIRARYSSLCDKVCRWLATGRRFSPGPPVSSTNKTDSHDITELLLKVALNTKQTNSLRLYINLNVKLDVICFLCFNCMKTFQ